MAKSVKHSRRWRDEQSAGIYYKKKFKWLNCCIYCGCHNQAWDHVLPISVAAQLGLSRPNIRKHLFQGLNLVPSCSECNSIAGSKPFYSIRAKRKFIQDRLKKKHKQLLRHVIWDQKELEDIGPRMTAEIKKAMRNRYEVEMRVSWPFCGSVAKILT